VVKVLRYKPEGRWCDPLTTPFPVMISARISGYVMDAGTLCEFPTE